MLLSRSIPIASLNNAIFSSLASQGVKSDDSLAHIVRKSIFFIFPSFISVYKFERAVFILAVISAIISFISFSSETNIFWSIYSLPISNSNQ